MEFMPGGLMECIDSHSIGILVLLRYSGMNYSMDSIRSPQRHPPRVTALLTAQNDHVSLSPSSFPYAGSSSHSASKRAPPTYRASPH
jgi:hypothetical protein